MYPAIKSRTTPKRTLFIPVVNHIKALSQMPYIANLFHFMVSFQYPQQWEARSKHCVLNVGSDNTDSSITEYKED